VNDAFFRFVAEMGGPELDKGKGGKYLIVPPGYTGALPKARTIDSSTTGESGR